VVVPVPLPAAGLAVVVVVVLVVAVGFGATPVAGRLDVVVTPGGREVAVDRGGVVVVVVVVEVVVVGATLVALGTKTSPSAVWIVVPPAERVIDGDVEAPAGLK